MKTFYQWFLKRGELSPGFCGWSFPVSPQTFATTKEALENAPPLKINREMVLAKVTVEPMIHDADDNWTYENRGSLNANN